MAVVPIEHLELLKSGLHLLDDDQKERAKLLLRQMSGGILNKYITDRHKPTRKQESLLTCDDLEVLYGGAAGGGKSIGLWMAALQYVHLPGYDALILRRTYTQLVKPGALMDIAREWMAPYLESREVTWDSESKCYRFPTGSTVGFGYLDSEGDKYNYQGAQYNAILFDELTQFTQTQYEYLFSRLRRTADCKIPPRLWAASNPGGDSHEFVKERFVPPAYSFCTTCGMHIDRAKECCAQSAKERFNRIWRQDGRTFIPATLLDNPYLDINLYRQSLAKMGAAVREQLEYGDWDVLEQGDYFRTEWFRYWYMRGDQFQLVDPANPKNFRSIPPYDVEYFVTADTASSQKADSAYTVICTWALETKQCNMMLVDVVRNKFLVPDIAPEIHKAVARWNAKFAMIEAKDSGIGVIQQLRNKQGLTIRDFQPARYPAYNGATDKISRSTIAQNRMEAGQIWLPRQAPWLHDFQAELLAFPQGEYADQVDNLSMAAIYANERALIGTAQARPMVGPQRPMSGMRHPGSGGFR